MTGAGLKDNMKVDIFLLGKLRSLYADPFKPIGLEPEWDGGELKLVKGRN